MSTIEALVATLADAVEKLAAGARDDGRPDAVLALGAARLVRAALAPAPVPAPPAPPPPPRDRREPMYFVAQKPTTPNRALVPGKLFPSQVKAEIRDLAASFGYDGQKMKTTPFAELPFVETRLLTPNEIDVLLEG